VRNNAGFLVRTVKRNITTATINQSDVMWDRWRGEARGKRKRCNHANAPVWFLIMGQVHSSDLTLVIHSPQHGSRIPDVCNKQFVSAKERNDARGPTDFNVDG